MTLIEDGTGSGNKAQVDANNRLHIQSVQIPEQTQATSDGDSYVLSTDVITLTGNSTLIYIKNNESKDLIVSSFTFGSGTATTTDSAKLKFFLNPTAGDLITDGTAVDFNSNLNAGSSKILVADAFKGKDGGTISGGIQTAILLLPAPIALTGVPATAVIPKGSSFAVSIEPNLSSGSVDVFAAIAVYLKDPENE